MICDGCELGMHTAHSMFMLAQVAHFIIQSPFVKVFFVFVFVFAVSFCLFFHVLMVLVLLKMISASYQQDFLVMPVVE